MPLYACPNCGSSLSSAAGPAPAACPACCALLRVADELPPITARDSARVKPALRLSLDPDSDAPANARHALDELAPDLGEECLSTCELLVSELVTNVVIHTPTDRPLAAADLRVRLIPGRVRVEVRDDGPGFTARTRPSGQEANSGWGLHLVSELADAWGVEPGVQNCVWFEVEREAVA